MSLDCVLGSELSPLHMLFDLILASTFDPDWGKFRLRGLFNWPQVMQPQSHTPHLGDSKAHHGTTVLPHLSFLTCTNPKTTLDIILKFMKSPPSPQKKNPQC